ASEPNGRASKTPVINVAAGEASPQASSTRAAPRASHARGSFRVPRGARRAAGRARGAQPAVVLPGRPAAHGVAAARPDLGDERAVEAGDRRNPHGRELAPDSS